MCAPFKITAVSAATVPSRRSSTGASFPFRATARPINDLRDTPASNG